MGWVYGLRVKVKAGENREACRSTRRYERACLVPRVRAVMAAACQGKRLRYRKHTHTRTHTRLTALFPGLYTRVSRYQKGKTNLDFTEARDSQWQWLQLGHMQVCTLLQTDNHASNPPLSFLQAGCPSCRPTNSVKALKGPQTDQSKSCQLQKQILQQIAVMELEGYS